MKFRKQLLITTAALALAPIAGHAAPIAWTGTLSNAWGTAGNWTPAGPPSTTSAVTIGNATNNPVQITTVVPLSGTGASLTINSGDSLNIGTGGSLTMGTKAITLAGGSLTASGTGTLSSTGTIGGYGTFSAPDTSGGNFNANNAAGALTLTGGYSLTGTLTTSSTGGGINLTGDTFSGSTAGSGGAINLNGATLKNVTLSNSGGQQLNVTGDSTLTGNINWSQYDTFNIGGSNGAHTLNLNTAGTTALSTVTGGANPFVIGAGGTLNNQSGIATMGGGGTVTLNGGSITGTSSSLFTIGDPISGHGTISGNVDLNAGNETVSGGTLILNGVTIGSGSSGPGFAIGSGNTLDLQGNITAYSFNVNPGGGLVKLDGTTITGASTNTSINNSGLTTTGTFEVTNDSSLKNKVAFSTGNGATLKVDAKLSADATSSINATSVLMNGGSIFGPGSLSTISGNISGFGTLSVPITGNISFNANGAAGSPLTLTGGGTINVTALTTTSTEGGFNLNGITLKSAGAGASLGGNGGQFNVTADDTLIGTYNWTQPNTFNIGGANGAHTLNLDTATLNTVGPASPFVIGTGGALNDKNNASSVSGGGTITLSGGSITNTSGTGGTTAGKFTVGDAVSGFGSVSGNVAVNADVTATGGTLTVGNGATVSATTTTVTSTGTLNLANTTGTTTLTSHNLTLAQGAQLVTGGAGNSGHNGITLSGNFSYQQTDTIHGWTNGGTAGLGPDLTMTGGTKATPVTLEAGGVNLGYTPAGFVDNFALNSLSLSANAYVELVDNYQNATVSGWTSGQEALYLNALYDAPGIPTLDLNGIIVYVQGHGFLNNGLYTDPNGGQINVIGQNPVPEPATLALLGTGLAGLGLLRRRRR